MQRMKFGRSRRRRSRRVSWLSAFGGGREGLEREFWMCDGGGGREVI